MSKTCDRSLEDVLEACHTAIIECLRQARRLYYETPVDVDAHGEDSSACEQDLECLRDIRAQLEERLSQ